LADQKLVIHDEHFHRLLHGWWTVTVGGGVGRRPEGRRSRWSVASGSPRGLPRGVWRIGWRNEEPTCLWVTRRAGPADAAINACKAPGRLGRRMLRIRLLRSTSD
ncbi:MAG TPA: hypothetical protein VKK19_14075, partial [Candidatus Dormibacteraeota bacterium]|nr:hypothetical protein [Candidatus Dormibacteraeota bacterium]